jgi:hypothetical protein
MDLATKYDLESRGGRVDEPESKDVLEIWSDEARAASAEARRKGGGGGGVSMPERSSLSLDEEMQKGSGVGVMGAAGGRGQPDKFKGPAAPEPSMLTAEEEAQKGTGIGTGIGAGSGAARAKPLLVLTTGMNIGGKQFPKGTKLTEEHLKRMTPEAIDYVMKNQPKGAMPSATVPPSFNDRAAKLEAKLGKTQQKMDKHFVDQGKKPSATVPPPKKKIREGTAPPEAPHAQKKLIKSAGIAAVRKGKTDKAPGKGIRKGVAPPEINVKRFLKK